MTTIIKKKNRSSNFTPSEIELLINLSVQFSAVIENKKTDMATWQEKEAKWTELTNLFNSTSSTCPRTIKNLKTKYESMKKEVRKKFANSKQELYKTGGGLGIAPNFTAIEEKLLCIISLSVEGLQSRNDSDLVTKESPEDVLLMPLNLENGTECAEKNISENGCSNQILFEEVTHFDDVINSPNTATETYYINSNKIITINSATEPIIVPDAVNQSTATKPNTLNKMNATGLRKPVNPLLQSRFKKKRPNRDDAIAKVASISSVKEKLVNLQYEALQLEINIKKQKAELEALKEDLNAKKLQTKIKRVELHNLNLARRAHLRKLKK